MNEDKKAGFDILKSLHKPGTTNTKKEKVVIKEVFREVKTDPNWLRIDNDALFHEIAWGKLW